MNTNCMEIDLICLTFSEQLLAFLFQLDVMQFIIYYQA